MPTAVCGCKVLGSGCLHVGGSCWRGDTDTRGDTPLFLAVVEGHDVGGTDARLPLAGAHCQAEAFRDDCAEVG